MSEKNHFESAKIFIYILVFVVLGVSIMATMLMLLHKYGESESDDTDEQIMPKNKKLYTRLESKKSAKVDNNATRPQANAVSNVYNHTEKIDKIMYTSKKGNSIIAPRLQVKKAKQSAEQYYDDSTVTSADNQRPKADDTAGADAEENECNTNPDQEMELPDSQFASRTIHAPTPKHSVKTKTSSDLRKNSSQNDQKMDYECSVEELLKIVARCTKDAEGVIESRTEIIDETGEIVTSTTNSPNPDSMAQGYQVYFKSGKDPDLNLCDSEFDNKIGCDNVIDKSLVTIDNSYATNKPLHKNCESPPYSANDCKLNAKHETKPDISFALDNLCSQKIAMQPKLKATLQKDSCKLLYNESNYTGPGILALKLDLDENEKPDSKMQYSAEGEVTTAVLSTDLLSNKIFENVNPIVIDSQAETVSIPTSDNQDKLNEYEKDISSKVVTPNQSHTDAEIANKQETDFEDEDRGIFDKNRLCLSKDTDERLLEISCTSSKNEKESTIQADAPNKLIGESSDCDAKNEAIIFCEQSAGSSNTKIDTVENVTQPEQSNNERQEDTRHKPEVKEELGTKHMQEQLTCVKPTSLGSSFDNLNIVCDMPDVGEYPNAAEARNIYDDLGEFVVLGQFSDEEEKGKGAVTGEDVEGMYGNFVKTRDMIKQNNNALKDAITAMNKKK